MRRRLEEWQSDFVLRRRLSVQTKWTCQLRWIPLYSRGYLYRRSMYFGSVCQRRKLLDLRRCMLVARRLRLRLLRPQADLATRPLAKRNGVSQETTRKGVPLFDAPGCRPGHGPALLTTASGNGTCLPRIKGPGLQLRCKRTLRKNPNAWPNLIFRPRILPRS